MKLRYLLVLLSCWVSLSYATVSIHLYGFMDMSKATRVSNQLKTTDKRVIFYINSIGGEVIAQRQIERAMRAYQARGGHITVVVKSFAISAAASLTCVGNALKMQPNSVRMFHTFALFKGRKLVKITVYNLHRYPDMKREWVRSHQDLVNCGLSSSMISKIERGVDVYIHANGRVRYV